MGVALAYARMRFEPGDEVLTTEHDFYATHESLRLREERDGVVVKKVRLYPLDAPETASADAIVSALAGGITPKTRAVAVTWVHSSSGVKLPLAEIGAAVARRERRPEPVRADPPVRGRRPRLRDRGRAPWSCLRRIVVEPCAHGVGIDVLHPVKLQRAERASVSMPAAASMKRWNRARPC